VDGAKVKDMEADTAVAVTKADTVAALQPRLLELLLADIKEDGVDKADGALNQPTGVKVRPPQLLRHNRPLRDGAKRRKDGKVKLLDNGLKAAAPRLLAVVEIGPLVVNGALSERRRRNVG